MFLFLTGEAGLLYVSEDDGEHWRALSTPYRGSFFGILRTPDAGLLVFGLHGIAVLTLSATQALVVGEGGVRTIVLGKPP